MLFTASERQERADLNGDGDEGDKVLYLVDPAGQNLVNAVTALTEPPIGGERLVAVRVFEPGQGGADFNLDGDGNDTVLGLYDGLTDTLSSTFLAVGSGDLRFDGPRVAFSVREDQQGNIDRNGDGDTVDWVPLVFDAATGSAFDTGMEGGSRVLAEGVLVFHASEHRNGNTDLNGDGDDDDLVLHLALLP